MVGGDGVLSRFSIDVVIIDWDYHRLWSPDQPNWAESDKHRHAWNIAIWRFPCLWLVRAPQPGLLFGHCPLYCSFCHGLAMNYFFYWSTIPGRYIEAVWSDTSQLSHIGSCEIWWYPVTRRHHNLRLQQSEPAPAQATQAVVTRRPRGGGSHFSHQSLQLERGLTPGSGLFCSNKICGFCLQHSFFTQDILRMTGGLLFREKRKKNWKQEAVREH